MLKKFLLILSIAAALGSCDTCDGPISNDPFGTPATGDLLYTIAPDNSGESASVFASKADGSETGLFRDSAAIMSAPVNGKMVYLAMRGEDPRRADIVVANTDGSNAKRIVLSTGSRDRWAPMLSRSGKFVAIPGRNVSESDEGVELVDVESGTVRLLVNDLAHETLIAFAPDSRRIAYYGVDSTLRVVDIATGISTVIDSNLGRIPHDLAARIDWSVTDRIAYGKALPSGNYALVISDPDGNSRTEYDVNVRSGSWSPDGTRIAFSTIDWDRKEISIRVMNEDGSGAFTVTRGPSVYMYPQWSPDGSKLCWVWWPTGEIYEEFGKLMVAAAVENANPRTVASGLVFDAFWR